METDNKIMELKDICIDLEYAKKLFETMKIDSIFAWFYDSFGAQNVIKKNEWTKEWICPAPTATELLELLPYGNTKLIDNIYHLVIEEDFRWSEKNPSNHPEFRVNYQSIGCINIPSGTAGITDKDFSNALAKMLIYLIENKLMEIK